MRDTLVVVPTYEERANVEGLARAVLAAEPRAEMLFVDDASPDGTGEVLDAMAAGEPRIHVLHREGKQGLGTAYLDGFRWALERSYEYVFEMDADFSHPPAALPEFLAAAEEADLVLGSRYLGGIRVLNWPLGRLMLSLGAARYVRVVTGMPFTDPTGGFKCFRRRALEALDFDGIASNGYAFQIEVTHRLWYLGLRIREIPIVFEERRSGQSKMSGAILREGVTMVWRLWARAGFRRRAPTRRGGPPVIPLAALGRAIRPAHWTKNAVVVAPLVFALGDPAVEVALPHLLRALVATAAFCLVSSAVYLVNDVLDREKDRHHPQKKLRPVATGELSVPLALGAAGGLALAGLLAAWRLAPGSQTVLLGYLVLQTAYSLYLKRIALVDILLIAAGFVLRALAGAAAVPAPVSPWLLLCTLLLALFLALCKRRHELVTDGGGHGNTRTSLRDYDARLLDQLISMIASATLVAYAVYTFWPDTVEKFGTHALGFTIPFVIFGLFRYLDLVYRQDLGGRPEQILLTDWPLLLDVALYGATVVGILWFHR